LQALEMHLADYTFHLLDTIFLCHLWGLKFLQKSYIPSPRKQQSFINKKIFFTFHVRELAIRYDTDLGDLHKVGGNFKFLWDFKIGVHVNPPNESVRALLAVFGAIVDRPPGTYGF
jgi:Glycosyl-transferase for dystroglycan